jgi:hypothetical protein
MTLPQRKTFTFGTFPYVEGDHYEVAQNGCWLWILKPTRAGYGRLDINALREITGTQYAHRAGWTLLKGIKLDKKTDLHHVCETPLCVNPDHLEVISRSEHLKRHSRAKSKLTEMDVIDIRNKAWAGQSAASLGREYGLPDTAIIAMCMHPPRSWRDVAGPTGTPPKRCAVCNELIERTLVRGQTRYCSSRCKTRANYLKQTPHRKRRPTVDARWENGHV